MYLSRLYLNPRSRQVRSELANPYEMHRTVMKAFAREYNQAGRILYRMEIDPRTRVPQILVQSATRPDWEFLCVSDSKYLLSESEVNDPKPNPAVKEFDLQLTRGKVLTFRLQANPSIKKKTPGKKNGIRLGILSEKDQLDWLQRKVADAGASLLSGRVSREDRITGFSYKGSNRFNLSFLSVLFEGTLQVVDPNQLKHAVYHGVGCAKGLGFGLLSLAILSD